MQTSSDYGPYLANEPSPLHTTTIVERCTEKLVDDWNKMRANVSSICTQEQSCCTRANPGILTAKLLALIMNVLQSKIPRNVVYCRMYE